MIAMTGGWVLAYTRKNFVIQDVNILYQLCSVYVELCIYLKTELVSTSNGVHQTVPITKSYTANDWSPSLLYLSSNHDYVLHVDLCTIVNTMHFLGTFWPNGEVYITMVHMHTVGHMCMHIYRNNAVMICRYYAYYAGVMLLSFAVPEHERKASWHY